MIRQRALSPWLLAAIVFWAPLPFASVTPWARALLDGASFAVLALVLVLGVERNSRLTLPRGVWLAAGCLVGLAVWGLLQSLAWPAGLVGLISPQHRELAREAAALLGGPEPGRVPLSLAAAASRDTALHLAAIAAAFVAAALLAPDRRGRRWVLGAAVVGALFQIVFGAQQWFATADTIWGVMVPAASRLRGSFVNPDHLALFLELALTQAFALAWWAFRHRDDGESFEKSLLSIGPPQLAWLTLFAGLAFTGSRAGLLASLAGTAVQGLLLATRTKRARRAAIGVLVGVVGLAVVAALGFEEGLGRLLGTSAYEVKWNDRFAVYDSTVELWQRFPLTGTGLGSFRAAFPMVAPPAAADSVWLHAHNDWLELLATTGLVGAGILLLGLFVLGRRVYKVCRRAQRSENRAVALAALGALVAVALHSALDFGLTMPANAFVLAVLCGAAAGAPVEDPRIRIEAPRPAARPTAPPL